MFFRIKPSGERRYLQIVENTRDGASTRQRVLETLGRVEDLEANGRLDALLPSCARFSDTALLISRLQAGTPETGPSLRIGSPMIFGGLWEQTGCHKVIERLAAGRWLWVSGGTRGVRQRTAPAGGLRLGSRLRQVAGRLSDRQRRSAGIAPALPRDGVAWRGGWGPERG